MANQLAGSPTAPTPPFFDADTSIATPAFVQRALGNMKSAFGVRFQNKQIFLTM